MNRTYFLGPETALAAVPIGLAMAAGGQPCVGIQVFFLTLFKR